jgi:hypothetical protein
VPIRQSIPCAQSNSLDVIVVDTKYAIERMQSRGSRQCKVCWYVHHAKGDDVVLTQNAEFVLEAVAWGHFGGCSVLCAGDSRPLMSNPGKIYIEMPSSYSTRSRPDILEVFLKKFFTGCSVLCGDSRPSIFVSSTSRANRHRTAVF